MFEELFRVGFVLALVLPALAVLAGLIVLIVPRFHSTAGVAQASVHP